MKRFIIILGLVAIVFPGCRKDKFQLTLTGVVKDFTLGGNLGGATVKLEKQALSGGVFSTNYESVGQTTSSSDGSYNFEFQRENVVEYRVTCEKVNYFPREYSINPDLLTPGETFTQNINMVAKAEISVRLENASPYNEFDQVSFQFLEADFDCECCDTDLRQFDGMDIDTTLQCDLWGQSWLKYYVNVDKDTIAYNLIDSIFCPAFETSEIHITY